MPYSPLALSYQNKHLDRNVDRLCLLHYPYGKSVSLLRKKWKCDIWWTDGRTDRREVWNSCLDLTRCDVRVIHSYVVNDKLDILLLFWPDSESFGKWCLEKCKNFFDTTTLMPAKSVPKFYYTKTIKYPTVCPIYLIKWPFFDWIKK